MAERVKKKPSSTKSAIKSKTLGAVEQTAPKKKKKTKSAAEQSKYYGFRLDPALEKPTIMNMIKRFRLAARARREDEGESVKKRHKEQKSSIIKATQIETTLKVAFQEEVDKINNGEINEFTFKVTKEAIPYMTIIKESPEFKHIELLRVGELEYKARQREGATVERL